MWEGRVVIARVTMLIMDDIKARKKGAVTTNGQDLTTLPAPESTDRGAGESV
jgi:hypothetical protein